MSNYKALLTEIDTFIFDYDGVMTDGKLILQHEGNPLRSANVKDGYVLQLAVRLGYRVVIISGGLSKSMENRFEALRINDVFLGVSDNWLFSTNTSMKIIWTQKKWFIWVMIFQISK